VAISEIASSRQGVIRNDKGGLRHITTTRKIVTGEGFCFLVIARAQPVAISGNSRLLHHAKA
jgi:hypothetical protein